MENQIEKFDPSTLMQGVKDRVKATFVSLIPDNQWDQMVQKEIDAFFNETSKLEVGKRYDIDNNYDYWNRKQYLVIQTEQTPFRAIVWGHCSDLTIEILKEKITKEYFSDNWANGQPEITDKMKEVIAEAAPVAAMNFFKNISYNMVNDLRNSMTNMR